MTPAPAERAQSNGPRSLIVALVASAALLGGPIPVVAQERTASDEVEMTATVRPDYTERLTPDNAVFVAVDYLTGFQPAIRTMDRYEYQNNLTGLSKTIETFGLPTIVLGDEGGPRGAFMPQMAEYFADAPKVARSTPSAWEEEAFRDAIAATGRRKIVFAGISTDNCTLLTGLGAMRDGYEVYVVVDVSGAESELIEDVAVTRLVQAGAVPVTWVSLGSELLVDAGGWETEQGQALARIYTDHTLYFQQ